MSLVLAENRAELSPPTVFDLSTARRTDDVIAVSVAVSRMVPFASVKAIVESAPPPRRPIRHGPINMELHAELAAWEQASDEALGNFED